MRETRIYLVNLYWICEDFTCEDIEKWDNERFVEESEKQGLVYSLKGFEGQWNLGDIPFPDNTYMRILNI